MNNMPVTNFSFNNTNVTLQNNLIRIEWTPSTDRTVYDYQDISYQYRCSLYTLNCGTDTTNYANYNTDTQLVLDTQVMSNVIYYEDSDGNMKAYTILTTPYENLPCDFIAAYEMRALNDSLTEHSEWVSITPFAILYNKVSNIQIRSIEWLIEYGTTQTDNIRITGQINNLGLSYPANATSIRGNDEYTAAWNAYRQGIANALGDFTFKWQYSINNTMVEGTKTDITSDTDATFNFSTYDWINNDIVTLDLVAPSDSPWSSDNSYYLWLYLGISNYSSTSLIQPNTTQGKTGFQLLQSLTPIFQMKKKSVRVHISKTNTTSTGAIMSNHNNLVADKSGNIENGHSIALYDTHVPMGSSLPANKPSMGFFDNENNEIGNIKVYNNNSGNSVCEINTDEVIGIGPITLPYIKLVNPDTGDVGYIKLERDSFNNPIVTFTTE